MAKRGGLGGTLPSVRPATQPIWAGFSIAEEEQRQAAEMDRLVGREGAAVQLLDVTTLEPNPFQARTDFTNLDELAEAIQQLGFFGTLPVRPHPATPDRYQIVFGERRLRAARQAGLEQIPCIVQDYSDDQLVEIGLAENIQREDLNPLDEAAALQGFVSQRGYSIRTLGERIGKGKSWVQERLALLEMPPDVQAMLRRRPDTLRAARGLARVEEPGHRAQLIQSLLAGEIGTRDIKRARRAAPDAPPSETGRAATVRRQIETIQRGSQRIRAALRGFQTMGPELDPEAESALRESLREIRTLLERVEQGIAR